MGRKFGIDCFLYHAVHFQFFQLLVDDAGAGILKMPVQFTGTFVNSQDKNSDFMTRNGYRGKFIYI